MSVIRHINNRLAPTLPRALASFFDDPFFPIRDHLHPSLDLSEDDKTYTVQAELPGVPKDNISLRFVSNNTLVLNGTMNQVKESEDKTFWTRERVQGTFKRVVTFPAHIDKDGVSAVLKDGVLKVTVPKAQVNVEEEGQAIPISE
jgi:HSP20 family protein